MIVLEHDAKELLAIQGYPVPGGVRLAQVPRHDKETENEKAGPWLVKPQIPLGKAPFGGRLRIANSPKEVAEATAALLGSRIDGHAVHNVRIERALNPECDAFLSFELDPQFAGIRVSVAAQSIDGESQANDPKIRLSEVVVPDPNAVVTCVNRLTPQLPPNRREPVTAAARQLAPLFFGYEALLIEINPLMIFSDGTWTAGDVKMILDENALFRHPEMISLIERREHAYIETRRKRTLGIDYAVVDPDGAVGMITTGAGLAMQMIDELRDHDLAPFNFLDAGIDALGDDPKPLTEILHWFQEAANVKVILITGIEGITDLSVLATGLTSVLSLEPKMRIPIVACLKGSDADTAAAILQTVADRVSVTQDIDTAIDRVGRTLKQSGHP